MNNNDGVYKVTFRAAGQHYSVGVVFLVGEKVYGGDASYFYRGAIETTNGKNVSGTLTVRRYFEGDSVFGPLDNFGLELSGSVEGDSFYLRGHVIDRADLQITVEGRRVAEGDG